MKLAVVGDIHARWGPEDVSYFNTSDYDAVLFVGDLPTRNLGRIYAIARQLAEVQRPTYLIPGNHDCISLRQLIYEVVGARELTPWTGVVQSRRVQKMRRSLGDITLCGYSQHAVDGPTGPIGLIAGRPHSMGGRLNFRSYLARRFGVHSFDESAEKICRAVDECPHERIIFLAHNGPTGLGANADDIWGCDFKSDPRDWGDRDLRTAIDYAREQGKAVLAVVAGHMHLRSKRGGNRPTCVVQDGVPYINAARVPRIFRGEDGTLRRHHVRLTLDDTTCLVETMCVRPDGTCDPMREGL